MQQCKKVQFVHFAHGYIIYFTSFKILHTHSVCDAWCGVSTVARVVEHAIMLTLRCLRIFTYLALDCLGSNMYCCTVYTVYLMLTYAANIQLLLQTTNLFE
jgi:hypothetical protein